MLISPRIALRGDGAVRANGGRGAVGENTFFLDHIGGSSGGGSGGYLVLQARDDRPERGAAGQPDGAGAARAASTPSSPRAWPSAATAVRA